MITEKSATSRSPTPPRKRLRVVLIGDQLLLTDSVGQALASEFEVTVVPPGDNQEAVARCRSLRPDLIVVCVGPRGRKDLQLIRRLAREMSDVTLFTLVESGGEHDLALASESVESGAIGYLTYDASLRRLAEALRVVMAGEVVLPKQSTGAGVEPGTTETLVAAMPTLDVLTDREREVLRRLSRGESTAEIAAALDIALYTVRTHVQNLLHKLGLHSKVQAAAYAVRQGLS